MRVSRGLGVWTVGLLLASAGAAQAGPATGDSARIPQRGPTLQRAHPVRMAGITKIDGRVVFTTPWIDLSCTGVPETTVAPAFDCYEGDPNSPPGLNVPTGFNTCPPNPVTSPPGNRWFFGFTNVQPRTFNDMTVATGFADTDATRVSFAWYQPTTTGNYYVAVSTYEDFGTPCTFPATPGPIDGAIFEFLPAPPPIPPATGSGYYADIDLSAGTTPLVLGLPADGTGAYDMEFYLDEAATQLVTLPGAQPFYWGTGEDEPTPDGRAGTQAPNEYQDDTAPYGGAYGAGECYAMTFAGICPPTLGPMVEFWSKGASCYPDCNADGNLTVQDFGCFQTKFVANDPYADCNGDANLTVQDFGCFQTQFVAGCP